MNAFEWVSRQPWAITPAALEGMLDVIERKPELVAACLARVSSADGAESVSARKGERLAGSRRVEVRQGVAVVPVVGPISRYMNLFEDVCGGTSTQTLATDLQACLDNPDVKSVLLNVDSPGGQAKGIGELSAMVRKAAGVKPVCAYVGGMACSAAYWIASSASHVVCDPTAELGSIGAMYAVDTRDRKVKVIRSSQSPNKNRDPLTADGEADMQALADGLADEFINAVAANRKTTPKRVAKDFGKGGTMLGRAAVKAGMADSLGDFEGTLARMAAGKPPVDDTARAGGNEPPGRKVTTKGATRVFNPFSTLAKLWATDPEAVQAAMESGDEGHSVPKFVVKEVPAAKAPAFDVEAERAKIRGEVQAEATRAARSAMLSVFEGQAELFMKSQVEAGKVKPAEVGVLSALFVAHAQADHDAPVALAAGGTVHRLDLFRTEIESRGTHGLTSDRIPEDATEAEGKLRGFKVLPEAKGKDDQAEAERHVAEILAATPEGRAALAAAKAAK